MKNDLVQKIEAVLFYLAEPVEVAFLAKTLEVSKADIVSGITQLSEELSGRGLRIIQNGEEVTMVTAPQFSGLIEKIIKEERERDLGRAGIETLAIIAYKGPVSKKEIEYIRGVNSQYALRNLLLRGLVEKKTSKSDERVIVYSVTTDTLRHLGVSSLGDLPEYGDIQKQLEVAAEALNTEIPEDSVE